MEKHHFPNISTKWQSKKALILAQKFRSIFFPPESYHISSFIGTQVSR